MRSPPVGSFGYTLAKAYLTGSLAKDLRLAVDDDERKTVELEEICTRLAGTTGQDAGIVCSSILARLAEWLIDDPSAASSRVRWIASNDRRLAAWGCAACASRFIPESNTPLTGKRAVVAASVLWVQGRASLETIEETKETALDEYTREETPASYVKLLLCELITDDEPANAALGILEECSQALARKRKPYIHPVVMEHFARSIVTTPWKT